MRGSLKNNGARHASIESHKCVLLSAGAVVGRRRPVRGRLRVQNFRVGLFRCLKLSNEPTSSQPEERR